MHALIQPGTFVALRLPSDLLKVIQLVPNTTISIGKYGSFPTNAILGRPYNLTFEILDKEEGQTHSTLRLVSALEIHADVIAESIAAPPEPVNGNNDATGDGVNYDIDPETGEPQMRSNRQTVDDPLRQRLTMEEIEALKKEGTGAGKGVIAQIMASHSALDQKTAFALAKYTLRKHRKYLRRFTVLPLDVPMLTEWLMTEKDPAKVMELREETLSLMGSWANVHWTAPKPPMDPAIGMIGGGRWLVVDETGGLVVAAMAERMGILYPEEHDDNDDDNNSAAAQAETQSPQPNGETDEPEPETHPPSYRIPPMSATTNTLTLIHSNTQPNTSLLKYFSFDTSTPSPTHPLYTHLKTLSWLQLVSPSDDSGYTEPDVVPDETLRTYKAGKRSTYYRKRRRWERIKRVTDETRAGGFDGLIVASAMRPDTILRHTVPLLRGAAQVVIYSPSVEPLATLADLYSTSRRTAFVTKPPNPDDLPNEDFPLNPTLLLAPTVQTARVRRWQCLPGRTHPLMTGKGGAEGYLFTATRVLPAEGKVEARGKFKRRKVVKEVGSGQGVEQPVVKVESEDASMAEEIRVEAEMDVVEARADGS
ncbi:MAG: tRNA (adenine(58)-N(1))-methyltransferase non-catalytic subunit trm6 [Caeruleum heppii]|nr:MAG: tRNA (adenine(58)-N(1))-methyltransferase non-catalytic subunit trm6 [Caeruleum heppii]